MSSVISCKYCGRKDFSNSRALSQHLSKNRVCKERSRDALLKGKSGQRGTTRTLQFSSVFVSNKHSFNANNCSTVLNNTSVLDGNNVPFGQSELVELYNNVAECEEESFDNNWPVDLDCDEQPHLGHNDYVLEDAATDSVLDNYNSYCESIGQRFADCLPNNAAEAVELLVVLRKSSAPLGLYELLMKWHFVYMQRVKRHQPVSESLHYFSRETLYKYLFSRYHMDPKKYNIERRITLPGSAANVNIIHHDAVSQFESLLTDPRIKDEDYLFFDNNPFAPPPAHIPIIKDINTGLAYTETYKKLITKPDKQILLPVIFYIDGAATGLFVDLNITAVKFTFGIFNRKAREKNHMWRTLGYIPEILAKRSRARRIYVDSGHVDAELQRQFMDNDEGRTKSGGAEKAQDLHTMFAVILESMLPLQTNGFRWDFFYGGKLYEDIEFIPFVPFICCDTAEADKLCGKYSSRAEGVSQLCRYCLCPTEKTDRPYVKFDYKTVPMISALVEENNRQGLKELSQQYIQNASYLLRFGLHNNQGVHGGTPLEMLHAILLGNFLYLRNCFFEQTGSSTQLGDRIDELCIQYGELYARQSDRDLPKTKFSGGIRKGKLQAKEYTGILLVLLTAIQCRAGQDLLTDEDKTASNAAFIEEGRYSDWIELLDRLLQWEAWLKSDEMVRRDVERSFEKHRHLMYQYKKVARRKKGMGLKIFKFHGIMHMSQDIINFGVPSVYDTGPMESGHKPTKKAAKVTQKQEDTFEKQTSARLLETHVLELAVQELAGRPLCKYRLGYCGTANDNEGHSGVRMQQSQGSSQTGGTQFVVDYDAGKKQYYLKLLSRLKDVRSVNVEQDFVNFVANLGKKIERFVSPVVVYSTHTRQKQIFRGTPTHGGKVWRDWVDIHWAGHGTRPAKIWGFVDLSRLPDDNDVKFAEHHEGILPSVYAIVESASAIEPDSRYSHSTILKPLRLEVRQMNTHRVSKLKFYLADVEAFVEPLAVVPDIGGAPNAYFLCRSRASWADDCIRWLQEPYEERAESECDSDDEELNSI